MGDANTAIPSVPPGGEGPEVAAWQKKLLPLMILMLVLLAIAFFAASARQIYVVQEHIREFHELSLDPALDALEITKQSTADDRLNFARWRTIALLESHALQSRYHQVSVAMMSRLYIIFLGFVTGMVLSLVGATFILGKLREEPTRVEAGSSVWKGSLTTASPGLLLVAFGTVLMIVTVWARADFEVHDSSVYIQPAAFAQPTPRPEAPRHPDDLLKSLGETGKNK